MKKNYSTPFHISEAVAIGIHATLLMAKNPNAILSAQKITEELKVSFEHCVRVLHKLRKEGILDSIRGINGGFKLSLSAENIFVLNVYEAIEGKLVDRQCLFRTAKCNGSCPLFSELLDGVNQQIKDYFNHTTLADLAKKQRII